LLKGTLKEMTPLEKYRLRQKKKFQAYVEKYADDPSLDWTWVSRVPMLDIEFIDKWAHKRWNIFWLSTNPSISEEEKIKRGYKSDYSVLKSMDDFKKWGHNLSPFGIMGFNAHTRWFSRYNKNIIQDVEMYPKFPWDWNEIAQNENITEDFVTKNLYRIDKNSVCWNNSISIEFFRSMLEQNVCRWRKREIAYNTNLNEHNLFSIFSEEEIKSSPEIQNTLTDNVGLSIDFIMTTLRLGWNRELINFRPDLTKEHILKYPDFPWEWNIISGTSSIDKNFLKTHPNTNFTEFYKYHSGLTIDEVEHMTPDEISENKLLGTLDEKADYLRQYYACRVIGNAFFNCYWFVDYAYCRKRLDKRYDELFGVENDE